MLEEDGLLWMLVMLPFVLILGAFVILLVYQSRIRTTRGLEASKARYVGAEIRRSGATKRFFPLVRHS